MKTIDKISIKEELDKLYIKYETKNFIKDDPVQFVHIFKNPKDIEIAGFISALFAFGKREMFIKKLFSLFNFMQMQPYEFIVNFDKKAYSSLEELFAEGFKTSLYKEYRVFNSLQYVCDYFYKNPDFLQNEAKYPGYKFMLSNPKNKGAMKRLNMFLRWMIRKNSPVDIGIWSFLDPSELLIPLDVHVGNISRSAGLLNRKQNDFKSVMELTEILKEFDPKDPIKYDFALFGYGVNRAADLQK